MKLLLTNDDGLPARGLAVLESVARQFGDVVVVAPREGLSGCGHRCTTDSPISVEEHGPGRYAIGGTPVDCVRLALHSLAPDVDWILSGINHGGNLGADIYPSGTVAAVREGALHARPGIALSYYRKKDRLENWEGLARWTLSVLQDLLQRPWRPGTFWNVNFPSLEDNDPPPEMVDCPVDCRPLPLSFRWQGETLRYNGDYHNRPRQPGSDVEVCFRGQIAVSLVEPVPGSGLK
jgi:5'-nucleotidase